MPLTIENFLHCATPDAWVQNALDNQRLLLIDHANCEKKAASTALNLMYRYVEDTELLNKMSRLAREELRHFEQVIAIMAARGIPYEQISASRYAAELRNGMATHEPQKLVDTLLIGAIIEARSCERFARLAPHLDAELGKFYSSLLKSESRHFTDYLKLAEKAAGGSCAGRLQELLDREQELILAPDTEFRFHSGPLAQV
ncbi:tRNA-(ms[2]io[6]A)-hydroxylase [Gilvimarinus sp. F26214L]|uniref:tRNA-(ms[2]io[6]A)-hydroxylase n=1 Tax=Gilvimarinus sp. DZF01 TaxID=3461371 RepID=UPI0040462CAD